MDEDDLIVQFVSITGASTADAAQYIEMSEGDMQRAVDLYLEMGSTANQGASTNRTDSSSGLNPGLFQEEVREAIPARYDQLLGGPQTPFDSMQGWLQQHMTMPDEMEANAVQDEFEEAGLGHLYRPPEEMNTPGTLNDAMRKAKDARKWLLVNIQAAEEFSSHILNRDVWSHETVKEVIRSAFVFWQRDKSSAQGSQFVTNYNIETAPVVCIVDPRTGRKLKQWQAEKLRGPLTATDLLSDFIGENPYGSALVARPSSAVAAEAMTDGGPVISEVINVAPSPGPAKMARIEERPLEMPTDAIANPGDPDEVKVAIRLSSGVKRMVSFRESCPVSVIRSWVSATENLAPSKFEVRLSHPPKPLDMAETVGSANVKGALLVVVLLS